MVQLECRRYSSLPRRRSQIAQVGTGNLIPLLFTTHYYGLGLNAHNPPGIIMFYKLTDGSHRQRSLSTDRQDERLLRSRLGPLA